MTIDEIREELQEEIGLCTKYFEEEDINKNSTERERLALKIATMCMQTLLALKDGELKELERLRALYSQVKWERDVAISKIEELGGQFGENPELIKSRIYKNTIDEIDRYFVNLINKGIYNTSPFIVREYLEKLKRKEKCEWNVIKKPNMLDIYKTECGEIS